MAVCCHDARVTHLCCRYQRLSRWRQKKHRSPWNSQWASASRWERCTLLSAPVSAHKLVIHYCPSAQIHNKHTGSRGSSRASLHYMEGPDIHAAPPHGSRLQFGRGTAPKLGQHSTAQPCCGGCTPMQSLQSAKQHDRTDHLSDHADAKMQPAAAVCTGVCAAALARPPPSGQARGQSNNRATSGAPHRPATSRRDHQRSPRSVTIGKVCPVHAASKQPAQQIRNRCWARGPKAGVR